jgi:RimJ/RimL family protein N-acetyltransferase
VTLLPFNIDHANDLYSAIGGESNSHLYTYMPVGPFPTPSSFETLSTSLLESQSQSPPPMFAFTVLQNGTAVGILSFLNIQTQNRSIEIGAVIFGPELQRTTAATETMFLMMGYAFELGFLRVEWKCNTFNKPSERAALRLGFVHEGVFRKHMVVKGKGRDSWWGSVVDEEWVGPKAGEKMGVRDALVAWLDEENFDGEGKQRRKLEDIRKGI